MLLPGTETSIETMKCSPCCLCWCGLSMTTRHPVTLGWNCSSLVVLSRISVSSAGDVSMPWKLICSGVRMGLLRLRVCPAAGRAPIRSIVPDRDGSMIVGARAFVVGQLAGVGVDPVGDAEDVFGHAHVVDVGLLGSRLVVGHLHVRDRLDHRLERAVFTAVPIVLPIEAVGPLDDARVIELGRRGRNLLGHALPPSRAAATTSSIVARWRVSASANSSARIRTASFGDVAATCSKIARMPRSLSRAVSRASPSD